MTSVKEPRTRHVRRERLSVDDILRLALDPGMRDVVRERVGRAWERRVVARARGEEPVESFSALVEAAVASLRST